MNKPKARILCVDDEPHNLSLLEAMLSPRGYIVVTAVNGPEALEKIRTERIDICLLDVMMPGMDGFEVCRRIKSNVLHRNIPVVMITSYADMENRLLGIEAGAEDFISNPFNSAEVLARIKMLLQVKSLNDQLQSAYTNIAKLSAFGEQTIISFDPDTFDFLENVDNIVHQIIRRNSDQIDSPEIIVIGMIDQGGICKWLRYDSIGVDFNRSTSEMILDCKFAFAAPGKTNKFFYNEDAPELAASALVREFEKQMIPVSNMVYYTTDSFCLFALNYGREVTTHDATLINSVVMQSLFLRSLALQIRDTEYAENIVETIREPLVVLNSKLKIITANQSFYDTFNVTSKETIGKFIYDLGNRQWDIPKLRVLFEEILPNATVINGYEVVHDFPGIGRKTILLNARQISREKVGTSIILLAMEDITVRKSAEEEIEKLNTNLAARAVELEDANQELEAFNYTVAHDLRKPLTVVNGYLQAIRELYGNMLDEACTDYLREAYDGTWRMNRLIDALLDFSRLGHVKIHRETVELSAMAHLVATELQLAEPKRRVTFLIADGISVDADAALLRVVLDNLLGNAWKYTGMRDEGIIEFGTTEVDGKPAWLVRDNGAGFDRADADELFTPFQRLPGAEEYKGFGIGLATVERIIRRHGGRVWAEGELGKGATFYFTLSADRVLN